MKMRQFMTLVENAVIEKETGKNFVPPDVPTKYVKRKSRVLKPGDSDIERLQNAILYFEHHRDVLDAEQVAKIQSAVADLQTIIALNRH
jgi:hypothetical protein